MPVTAEQCSTAPPVATLSNTLEMFDTFKAPEEEKDSDEESFHLPLDDEGEKTGTEDVQIKVETGTANEENEDEILNKFEMPTANTPDILDDPKLEESLLDDKDESKEEDKGEYSKENVNNVEQGLEATEINTKEDSVIKDIVKTEDNVDIENKGSEDIRTEDVRTEENKENIGEVKMEIDENETELLENISEDSEEKLEEGQSAVVDTGVDKQINNDDVMETETSPVAVTKTPENDEDLSAVEETVSKNVKPSEESAMDVTESSDVIDAIAEVETDQPKVDASSEDLVVSESEKEKTSEDTEPEINEETAPPPDKSEETAPPEILEGHASPSEKSEDTVPPPEKVVNNTPPDEESIVDAPSPEKSEDNSPSHDEKSEDTASHLEKGEASAPHENSEDTAPPPDKSEESLLEEDEREGIIESAKLNEEADDTYIPAETVAETIEDIISLDKDISEKEDSNCELVTEIENKEENSEISDEKLDDKKEENSSPSNGENKEQQKEVEAMAVDEDEKINFAEEKLSFPEPSTSPNLESEDLLDISMIRDQDEDDADLVLRCNETESSDKDYQEIDETSNEKTENEEDNIILEADKDDKESIGGKTSESNDVEPMDIEDEDETVCLEDDDKEHLEEEDKELLENETSLHLETSKNNDTIEMETESDIAKICEIKTVDSASMIESSDKDTTKIAVTGARLTEDVDDEEKSRTSSTKDEEKNEDSTPTATTLVDEVKSTEKPNSGTNKRPLTETDESDTAVSKKIKLTPESEKKADEPKTSPSVKSLIKLADYMKNKHLNKLTRSDLEEFCVQKICEVIVHKSEIGEINQQLRMQEQMVEQLRKDQQQLNKQVRDLEIVNKKLMQELRSNNGPKKPLIPLKITRSVGLQVKLTVPETHKRRPILPAASPQKTVIPQNRVPPRPVIVPAPSPIARSVSASPQKSPSNPILSSVLQNRKITQASPSPVRIATTPIRMKPAENKAQASVIDLTDEDDKKKTEPAKKVATTPITTTTRQIATINQGVRLATPSQVKTTPLTGVVTSSAPQLMYVLQPGTQLPSGVLTSTAGGTQKAVLLNFQPNGILTPALNGPAVSVLPKVGSNVPKVTSNVSKVTGNVPKVTSNAPKVTSNAPKVTSNAPKVTSNVHSKSVMRPSNKHPAPLPVPPMVRVANDKSLKPIPPKPHLSIRKTDTGIILQWRMPYDLDAYENIASYQLYAYQETNSPPSTDMWRRVGDVKALALPMACTLTQFADKNKYYFAVRPVDVYKRIGAFSEPEEISL